MMPITARAKVQADLRAESVSAVAEVEVEPGVGLDHHVIEKDAAREGAAVIDVDQGQDHLGVAGTVMVMAAVIDTETEIEIAEGVDHHVIDVIATDPDPVLVIDTGVAVLLAPLEVVLVLEDGVQLSRQWRPTLQVVLPLLLLPHRCFLI